MSFFQKISTETKKFFINKRGAPFFFLGLTVLLFLFSPSSAGAVLPIIGSIVGLALSVITVVPIVVAIYAFIILISQVFVQLAGAILNWVTSPGFISISYTNPNGPDANLIVRAGLDITKNFVNLALVVILVYIAVAIALRLGENNAKRLFAKLIVVALLVNFAPLLVGLIVDASNIVMNYFLVGIKDGIANVLTQFSSTSGGILSQLIGLVTLQTSIIAKGFVMVILNFATGIALLLYAILFIFRYIAIWTIVILSPLAFVAWILPATKKYWDMWWSNLIQWSIIGIPIAFFLYLGTRAYEVLPSLFKTQMETVGIGPEVAGLMNQTFPYFVVLAFLYLGFTLGLQTSAMGATNIIGWSKKAGGWAAGRIWKGASTWTQERAQIREKVGGITKKWEEIPVARWFLPEAMRKYSEMRPAIEEARKKLSIHSHPELGHKAAVGDIYGKDAVGALVELVEAGDSNDWFKEHMKHYGINPEDEDAMEKLHDKEEYRKKMARLLWIAREGGYHNTIIRGSPRLAEFAVDAGYAGYKDIPEKEEIVKLPKEKRREAIRNAATAMAVDDSRTQHVKNWEREDILNKAVVSKTMERGEDFQRAIFTQVKKGHGVVLETVAEIFKDFAGQTENQGKPIDSTLWKKFRDDFKKNHGGKAGFFLYLDSPQAKRQGWTRNLVIKMAGGTVSAEEEEAEETDGRTGGGTGGGETGGGGRRTKGRKTQTARPTAGGATGMTP